jgi:hypothetical protein
LAGNGQWALSIPLPTGFDHTREIKALDKGYYEGEEAPLLSP